MFQYQDSSNYRTVKVGLIGLVQKVSFLNCPIVGVSRNWWIYPRTLYRGGIYKHSLVNLWTAVARDGFPDLRLEYPGTVQWQPLHPHWLQVVPPLLGNRQSTSILNIYRMMKKRHFVQLNSCCTNFGFSVVSCNFVSSTFTCLVLTFLLSLNSLWTVLPRNLPLEE